MHTYSLAQFNYFVVTKAATERCFLKMVAPNKLIKSLGNTLRGSFFGKVADYWPAVLLGMSSLPVVFQGFCRYCKCHYFKFWISRSSCFSGNTSQWLLPLLAFTQSYLFGEMFLTGVNSPYMDIYIYRYMTCKDRILILLE